MSTLKLFAVVLISATVATAAFAKGPGGSAAGNSNTGHGRVAAQSASGTPAAGAGGGAAQGTQTRSQTRDPASNPTGSPIQARDRIHTPGTGLTTAPPQ